MANRLTAYLYGQKAGDRDTVTVFDVGCSGGISDYWNGFGRALRAAGFDPLVTEIDRLRSAEKRHGVCYEAAFVGLSAAQEAERAAYQRSLSERERFDPGFQARSSASHAFQLLSYDNTKEMYNSGREVVHTNRQIALDDLPRDFGSPDFIKVDTDGHDICVIMGAQRQLESALGVKIECRFNVQSGRYANSFANVDRFMRSVGFSLFHIDPQRYTRASLPGTFCYNALAQTQWGPVGETDAIYFRDLAHPDYDRVFGFHPTGEQVLKLACLMESFGLSDCSAELLIARADLLPYPLDELLDKLVPKEGVSYRDFIKAFDEDPRSFFPSRRLSIFDSPLVAGRSVIDLREARNHSGWGSSIERASDSHLTIKPGTTPWAYAATLPLPSRSVGAVELDVEVVEGTIGLASANSDLTELGTQVFIEKSGRKVVILPLTEGTSDAVVVRGGTPSGAPSAISIYGAFLLNA